MPIFDRAYCVKMLSLAMQSSAPKEAPRSHRVGLSQAQRDEAVALYEAGVANGRQLADRYGVSRHMIYRHLNAAGAVKGRLAHRSTRRLHAEIDQRQLQRKLATWNDENRRLDAFVHSGSVIEQFMNALLQADRDGRLAEFGRKLGSI